MRNINEKRVVTIISYCSARFFYLVVLLTDKLQQRMIIELN